MPNRINQYYVGDDVTFRGIFKIDGVEQTPDAGSAKVQIWKIGETSATVTEAAATITGTQISYKYSPLVVGQYTLFFYATFNTAADKRTGVIEFMVRKKESH